MAGYKLDHVSFLIVDDNKPMRGLVRTILHALGARNVLDVDDAAEALKALRSFPADFVITDWNMQPLDGIEFVRLIRTGDDSPNPFVPIIMLTGHTEMHHVAEARDAGVTEFLAKPISVSSLYTRVKNTIENPRTFVRTGSFFGPDRRRRKIEWRGPERRKPA
jgi:two-component system chemotaxis response regulator CheY